VNLGGPVNTPFEESAPSISSDYRSLYFNRDPHGRDPTRPDKADEDLYVANRSRRGAAWSEPVALESLNTQAFDEQAATVSRDGTLLFFASNREGGFGGLDLYMSRRLDAGRRVHGTTWAAPENLGATVNTPDNELGPAHFVDARGNASLYFTRNPAGDTYDIYVARLAANGRPGTPSPVRNLNTRANDARPAIRADGLEIVFHSNRAPSVGAADLWVSTRAKFGQPWRDPVSLGAQFNSTSLDQQPALSGGADELYFASNRGGQDDIWFSTRRPRR
jgi:Tol biopolymer transport system component